MHSQGLNRRPQMFFAFVTSEFGSPKKWFAIAQENCRNGGYVRFRARLILKNGRTGRDGQPDA